MIEKNIYDDIASHWEGEVFQNWDRISSSMPLFEKILPDFAGRRVLEIGCNAGIYAWHIAPIAKSYIGIDVSENFIRQAQVTAQFIKGAPVRFMHTTLGEFASDEADFDMVFASYVLYHVSDEEVEIFEKTIAPRCDVLAVQIRTRKKKSANSYDFMKAANIKSLFSRAGFDCRIYWKDWKHTAYAAVGRKRPS